MRKIVGTCAALLVLALAGCSGTTNPETGLNATEETCAENRTWMETEKECIDMTAAEKAKANQFAHDKQVEGEEHEAEKVIKQRHAEELANAAEGR
jgi:Prokaryotic membrane lipoprotein lipid attachment site